MSDLPKRLRIKAGMIALGERVAWGSDTALMEEAADVIEALSASVENHQLHMLGMARDRDQLRAPLTAQPQASAAQSAPVEDKGWPGRDYWCKCRECGEMFTGHKRQLVCRVCTEERAAQSAPAGAVPEGYRWYLVPKEDTDAFNAACSAANDAYLGGVGPCGVFIAGYRAMLAAAPAQPAAQGGQRPELTVWEGPMPESNGKSNFTAVLMRKGANLFDGIAGGMTIARSEYPDRVRYEADCVRYLIGELQEEPCIIGYDAEKHSGYVASTQPAAQGQGEVQRLRGQDGQDDQGNIVLTPQAVDVLAQCVAAHAYVLGALVNGRPDLALIEAKKWVDGFRDAASTGQEE